ncbi:unnamed protein product [Brassica rapa]|uniref:Plant thionin family protein n=1 Tax=Brassica campestris TaxID=3711 RepID=A0A3P6BJI9_BRACM|nr:unnamed protein product [Brassica rapa]VDD02546.1 unnamed protein product [Brassica rapa]
MGKVICMVWIMMILAVLVIGGEAKSEIECSKICRPHCQRSSPASECAQLVVQNVTSCHRLQ